MTKLNKSNTSQAGNQHSITTNSVPSKTSTRDRSSNSSNSSRRSKTNLSSATKAPRSMTKHRPNDTSNRKTLLMFSLVWLLIVTLFVSLYLLLREEKRKDEPNKMQIHLSLGSTHNEMAVTWHLTNDTAGATTNSVMMQFVHYGRSSTELNLIGNATCQKFNLNTKNPQSENNVYLWTFRALMVNLQENTVYYYKVGSEHFGWSAIHQFTTLQSSNSWNPWILILADLGLKNGRSLPSIVDDVNTNQYCAAFHIGDIAYNLNSDTGTVGNRFMESIEPIASKVPYQVCPGNHEKHDNFSHYDARFTMIQRMSSEDATLTNITNHSPSSNHFHSVHIGPAHFIMFSTEFYYYCHRYGWQQIERQFNFLKQDLREANQNRAKRPWIVAMGHRPMYCLKETRSDTSCFSNEHQRPSIRTGIPELPENGLEHGFGLESLFFEQGVDLILYGHDHFYARTFPLYNFNVRNGTSSVNNPYHNPNGPIHVVTGAAGNHERHARFLNPIPEFVAFHNLQYGYTRLKFGALDRLHLEQISADQKKVVDQITIVKDNAKPLWMD